jgi:Na+/melibiose symporter-like transporter
MIIIIISYILVLLNVKERNCSSSESERHLENVSKIEETILFNEYSFAVYIYFVTFKSEKKLFINQI